MSVSIIVLKKIKDFSCVDTLNSVKKAADKANMHCIFVRTCSKAANAFEGFDGTLSEVDEETFREKRKNDINVRSCGFSIQKPDEFSYDSFTWLIGDKNYFRALDLEYLFGDYEFAFRFLAQYFSLEENKEDYMWFDDAEWYYTAQEIVDLSKKPYNPYWSMVNIAKKSDIIYELTDVEKQIFLEGQVGQAVLGMGILKGIDLKLKRANRSLAGNIDALTDKYIIEIKRTFGAVKKEQLDKLINPNNADYFNFDGKGIIYYIEDAAIDNPHKQKMYDMLKNTENVKIVHNLEELKGVLLS